MHYFAHISVLPLLLMPTARKKQKIKLVNLNESERIFTGIRGKTSQAVMRGNLENIAAFSV